MEQSSQPTTTTEGAARKILLDNAAHRLRVDVRHVPAEEEEEEGPEMPPAVAEVFRWILGAQACKIQALFRGYNSRLNLPE